MPLVGSIPAKYRTLIAKEEQRKRKKAKRKKIRRVQPKRWRRRR